MGIIYDEVKKVFLLNTPASTYAIRIIEDRYVLHGGWVPSIKEWSDVCVLPMIDRSFSPVPQELHDKKDFSLDAQQLEFSSAGHGDFRESSLDVLSADGTLVSDLFYDGFKIVKGKPGIKGLPSTYAASEAQVETLELYLKDKVSGLKVTLVYNVWNDRDVICRHTVLENEGGVSGIYKDAALTIKKAMSASVDFMGSRYKMLQLNGAHARERHVVTRKLVPGIQAIQSSRYASSHQQNPFLALMDYGATETTGNVYGFSFVYSGSFKAQVEVDQFNMSRVTMGLNPNVFEWKLEKGESFVTPEVVMVYSQNGIGEMSRTYHDLYRDNLCRGEWQKKERPIVINNWEATYFDFNAEKIFKLADEAVKEGIELFVLDDGWFGKRNDDRSSLGDWFVNTNKLKGGLEEISEGIHKRGMQFGLWFEPEMISPDSELYRKHPDWALTIPGRNYSLGRHQMVLDLSRKEVVDYLDEQISTILSNVKIDYVKWDFNRSPTEIASCGRLAVDQLKTSHLYYLGLYDLLERLTSKFPQVLFESCSGGGGRFDPAMFYYMPQCWTSDNTDALSRVAIQEGTSIVYPTSGMSCHVSAVPNHQSGRITSLSERGHCAMAGTYGYELNLNALSQDELDEIKEQVVLYKRIRNTIQYGDFYRLESSWNESAQSEVVNYSAWNTVSKDKSQCVFTIIWTFPEANAEPQRVKLCGLDKDATYRLSCPVRMQKSPYPMYVPSYDGLKVTGAELMNIGLFIACMPQYGGSLQIVAERI